MVLLSESPIFPDHSSGFPFIHPQCISFCIFVQEDDHMLPPVFFLNTCMRNYLAQTPAKKKRAKLSLKFSVVHLDTVGVAV